MRIDRHAFLPVLAATGVLAFGISVAAQFPTAPASPGVSNPPNITAKDLADGLNALDSISNPRA